MPHPALTQVRFDGVGSLVDYVAFADQDGDGDLELLVNLHGNMGIFAYTHCASGGRIPSAGQTCFQCPVASSRYTNFDQCSECDAHAQADVTGTEAPEARRCS